MSLEDATTQTPPGPSPGPQPSWPEDATLYQPERMLLSDCAQSLGVQAYLRMCALPFRVCYRANAEHMSPSGRVPLVRAPPGRQPTVEWNAAEEGGVPLDGLASSLEETVSLIARATGGRSTLSDGLGDVQRAEMKAYAALVESRLGAAELYVLWCCDGNAESSRRQYGGAYPWPLGPVLAYWKQREVRARLRLLGWAHRSPAEVYEEVERCCRVLSHRLGAGRYFFHDQRPTELDALVFGHLFSILTTALPAGAELAEAVKNCGNLVSFCERVDQDYFK